MYHMLSIIQCVGPTPIAWGRTGTMAAVHCLLCVLLDITSRQRKPQLYQVSSLDMQMKLSIIYFVPDSLSGNRCVSVLTLHTSPHRTCYVCRSSIWKKVLNGRRSKLNIMKASSTASIR